MPGLPIVPLSFLRCCAVSAARARLCISFQASSLSDCQVLGGRPSTNWCLPEGAPCRAEHDTMTPWSTFFVRVHG